MIDVFAEPTLQDVSDIAPSGTLRVAINLGNSVLAQPGVTADQPRGITPKLARELARRLGVPLTFVIYQAAGHVFAAAPTQQWDVAFLAQDPKRTEKISFSSPYLVLEGTYLVRDAARYGTIENLDQPGVRIAVAENAAYDLFLTRTLKHAQLARASTPSAAFELFHDRKAHAVAGVRQVLLNHAVQHAGSVVLPGQFSAIAQAIRVPTGRPRALALIEQFVLDLSTRFVHDALASAEEGAGVAAV